MALRALALVSRRRRRGCRRWPLALSRRPIARARRAALDHRQLARPDAGQRLVEVGVHEVVLGSCLSRGTTRRPEPAVSRLRTGRRCWGSTSSRNDLRGEAVLLVDRMQMVQHRVGGFQHVRHQRFPDALLQPVEVEALLGLLGLALELALDHVGQERVQLRAHQVVAGRVRLAHRADGRPGVQHVPDLRRRCRDPARRAVTSLVKPSTGWRGCMARSARRAFLKMSGSSAASMMASS